jgi:mannose-1-phosphate guanylyltransferase
MKAVLLAAGLGTRLRPLTDTTPKCLVRIGERTLLDIWLDALADLGVEEVLVNTHHLADQVAAHVVDRRGDPPVRLLHEPTLRGSAGTLRAARQLLESDRWFLAVNADNLTDYDLAHLVLAHSAAGEGVLATLTAFHAPSPSACGIFEVDGRGRLRGFEEKPAHPRSDLANAGIYAFSREVIDLVEGPDPVDVGTDLLPRLVGRAQVVGIGAAYLRDIGTLEALAEARATWREGAHR